MIPMPFRAAAALLAAGLLLAAPALAGEQKAGDKEHAQASEHGQEEGHGHEEGHAEEEHGSGHGSDHGGGHGGHSSRISDVAKPLDIGGMPERPKPVLEVGEPFLGTGTLHPGFTLPTGAVWQPQGLLFGTWRTALQSFEPDSGVASDGRITELTTRLDLFFNLALSGSERLVVGVRALDGDGRFTSYFFEHPDDTLDGEFQDELDLDLEALFFEGDFGEIFPNLDKDDFGITDFGFSAGRQNLLFQEGLLINDTIDGVGITRNTLLPGNTSNVRATFFYGWNNIDVANGVERDAQMFAVLTSTDVPWSTIDADIAYLRTDDGSGDLVGAGVSFVQRLGATNSSFRLLASQATDEETAFSTDGALLFSELSWVPHGTHDLLYFNAFWAFDRYSPIARGVGGLASGPLGRAGINFASVDIGSFNAPLSAQAWDVAGGAVGYQAFFDHGRSQLLGEIGFRFGTEDTVADAYAATLRYQVAYGRRAVFVFDAFGGYRELLGGGSENPYGGRVELVLKF